MRAVRAAATRGEADDRATLGRSSKHYHSILRTREPPSNHRSSRPRVRLPPEPESWGSRRQATTTLKQRRIRKGSAVKRSRVHMSVAAARGPAGRQSDADSRFPMPYPGVDRATTQLQNHLGERRSPKRVVVDSSGSRRAHSIEEHSREPTDKRLRTRPRSATVLPLSQTGGSAGQGCVNENRKPPKSKRKHGISKAAAIGERDGIGGSKKSRPASAPPARGVLGHQGETRDKSKSEAGVLLALSRMADGSSCAPGELRIMKWVVLRETYLTKLHGVVSADRRRDKSGRKRPSPKLLAMLTELLTVLRRITVEIVEAVEKWRRRDKSKPFIWGSSNYLVKAAGDIEFLSRLPGLEDHIGVVITDNPFLTHTGLDGRSTVLDRSSIRSRSGKFPLGTSEESFGVSAERVAAAAAVLYREVQRARRGRGRVSVRDGELSPCSDESPRLGRSPSRSRHRPIGSPGRRSPAGPGSGRRPGGSKDRPSSRDYGERRRRPQHSPGAAAAAAPPRRAVSPRGEYRRHDYRNGVQNRNYNHREEQIVSKRATERHQEEAEEEEEQKFRRLGDDDRRVSQPSRRRSSAGPEPADAGSFSRQSPRARRSLASTDFVAVDDRPISEERQFDDRRRDSSSQTVRRRSSAASELTEPDRDYAYTQHEAPRWSSPYRSVESDVVPRSALRRSSEQGNQYGEPVHRDNRRATQVWHTRNTPVDGGRRRASQGKRRRSTGSDDSRHAQRGARPSLPYYAAVVENNNDESHALPPDDQSLDYQNGEIPPYRDDEYYYEQQEDDGGGAYNDDDQNLDYYYDQQEGGYETYAEVEPQAEYGDPDITTEDERFASGGKYDDPVPVDSDRAQRRPSDGWGDTDHRPAQDEAAPAGGAAAAQGITSAQTTDGLVGPPLEPATSDQHHHQRRSSNDAGEPAAVTQTTQAALPAVVDEETRSLGDPDPNPDPLDGNHGRMGRRGSPFNLIFNMCDGMLTDLKGLGGRSQGGEDDDAYQFEPMMLGDLAGTRDRYDGLEASATGGAGANHEEGGASVPLAQDSDAEEQNAGTTRAVAGGRQAETPPPKLRGATYASLTRDIVAMGKGGSSKSKKSPSGDDEEGAMEDSNHRVVSASFLAWAERTEGRLRHRDAKASRHHRLHQLRHAMSVWETHRARFLGDRMAEAFAGCFGLSSRFFVRFAFDALRMHAKGARIAARNRGAVEKLVSHLERFGKARLRQAWRRWAPPKMRPEYWGAEHEEALKKLGWHWGRGRLRGALGAWRQREPTLHSAGSFAVLKGRLRAAGSFAKPKAASSTRKTSSRQPQAAPAIASQGGDGGQQREEEDSWAEWLANEASFSVVSPDGEKGSLRAVPEAGSNHNRVGGGEQALAPTRSFRGLGAALNTIKSFRDGRDKSQIQRRRLRPTASFGSPPHSPGSTPAAPSPPSSSPSPAAANTAAEAADALQARYFAANRTKLRSEAARLRSRQLAATTIQRALWRAPRERRVAARASISAVLIQRMVRLRSRRARAGLRLVRAWRRRVRARAATLDRALVEAAGEGDLRAVAFLLRPPAAAASSGVKQGVRLGLRTGLGGADANATAGTGGETALHAAASAGSGNERRRHALVTTATKSREKGAGGSGLSTVLSVALTGKNGSASSDNRGGDLLQNNELRGGSGGSWLRGQGSSPNWAGVIQTLVEAGAMIEARDRRGFTPMMTAAAEGSRETVAVLATVGAELDTKEMRGGKRTPLVLAAQEANAQAAAALLEYGAKANLTVGDSLTPLHEAVGAGSIAVAEMLVRAGANVNAKSESGGMTPLHLAVANGQHVAARLLVHSGANVCLPDSRGLTCLRLTVEMADAPTVALLLAAEPPADLSVEDENGGTVLHAACRLGLTDIAQLLLQHGADPHVRDARGRTPELVALDLGHVDCAGLFYNMDIHTYTPKQITDSGGSSDDDDASSEGRKRGHDESGSQGGGGAHDDADARGSSLRQRDGETGGAGGAWTSTASRLSQGFNRAAAARRASSLSKQQQQPEEDDDEEGQADPRRKEASASSSSFASGEEAPQWHKAAAEKEEPRRGEEQPKGHTTGGSYAEREANAEQHTEGYDDGDEGNTNNAKEREGAGDWEWSETEGWIRAAERGVTDVHAGAQAPPSEEQLDGRAADNFRGDEGYPSQGYGERGESESYSDWQQQPYYSTVQQGESRGGSYDGTAQGDQQQQQQRFSYSSQGGGRSYDNTADGVSNDDNPRQDPRNDDYFERQADWEVGSDGRGGGPAELLRETSSAAAVAAARGEGYDNRGLLEAALGEEWTPTDPDKGPLGEGGRTADGTVANQETTEDGSGSGRDASSSSGWGSAFAAVKASNRWMSLLDRSSGSVYYQNERSGQTEWDLPEGAVVVSSAPEDA